MLPDLLPVPRHLHKCSKSVYACVYKNLHQAALSSVQFVHALQLDIDGLPSTVGSGSTAV